MVLDALSSMLFSFTVFSTDLTAADFLEVLEIFDFVDLADRTLSDLSSLTKAFDLFDIPDACDSTDFLDVELAGLSTLHSSSAVSSCDDTTGDLEVLDLLET